MKFALNLIPLVAAVFMIASCSSDSTTTTTTSTPFSGTVQSASGAGYPLDGTWSTVCRNNGSNDNKATRVVSGSSLTGGTFNYTSNDFSCIGGETLDTTTDIVLTMSDDVDFVADWSDASSGLVPAPTAQDGTTIIDDPATATRFDVTGTIGGSTINSRDLAFIDDTDPAGDIIWYPATQAGAAQCLSTTETTLGECLSTSAFEVFILQ